MFIKFIEQREFVPWQSGSEVYTLHLKLTNSKNEKSGEAMNGKQKWGQNF
jgi:hypothetical protein